MIILKAICFILAIWMAGFVFFWGKRAALRMWYRLTTCSRPSKRVAGDKYYTIVGPLVKMKVRSYVDDGTFFHSRNYALGNYFASEVQAQHRMLEIQYLNLDIKEQTDSKR